MFRCDVPWGRLRNPVGLRPRQAAPAIAFSERPLSRGPRQADRLLRLPHHRGGNRDRRSVASQPGEVGKSFRGRAVASVPRRRPAGSLGFAPGGGPGPEIQGGEPKRPGAPVEAGLVLFGGQVSQAGCVVDRVFRSPGRSHTSQQARGNAPPANRLLQKRNLQDAVNVAGVELHLDGAAAARDELVRGNVSEQVRARTRVALELQERFVIC